MTPADYAEALEGAADLLDEWVVIRDHGDYDAGKAANACRALAKALREAVACAEFNNWAPKNEYVIELP